ncbi:MAG: MarR family transcriptional regulator [Chloroflexota bacterium]|nr:MarR family transcriptional regulator [Chloroflexota bacterium]
MTTAWWQALGALFLSPAPLPVAHIARNMGLSRQSVQRVVDLLAQKGLVRFEPNPHHQRAKLVVLTPEGREAVSAADERQRPLASDLTAALGAERLVAALEVLTEMDLLLARAGVPPHSEIDQKEAQP